MQSRARLIYTRLQKKMRHGYKGEPVGSVAFYGPDGRRASKVVASLLEDGEILYIEKWFDDHGDVRDNDEVMKALESFLAEHGAKSFAVSKGLMGCPHEEIIDYPEGEACPECPYWAGRDRFQGM